MCWFAGCRCDSPIGGQVLALADVGELGRTAIAAREVLTLIDAGELGRAATATAGEDIELGGRAELNRQAHAMQTLWTGVEWHRLRRREK
jgi:hypothetical protein